MNTRILIAEDNSVNQKVARRQVEKLGYRADVVANGLEALNALAKVPYDIILMDCQMPEMDGYEATAAIRQREGAEKHTVIIAMTANALKGDREKCLAAGMDDYLSKPVKAEDLQIMLEQWQFVKQNPETPAKANPKSSFEKNPPIAADSMPFDMKQLEAFVGSDKNMQQELIELYLQQMSEGLVELKTAAQADAADEIKRLAHKLVGSSLTCGIVAVVPLLRELEEANYGNASNDALPVILQIEEQVKKIENFVRNFFKKGTNDNEI